jgi:hypothetical protein
LLKSKWQSFVGVVGSCQQTRKCSWLVSKEKQRSNGVFSFTFQRNKRCYPKTKKKKFFQNT